jgi:hypothetical protein
MAVTMLAFCLLAIAARLGVTVVAGRGNELPAKAS